MGLITSLTGRAGVGLIIIHSLNEVYHIPVLLKESVDGLDIKQGGVYVDVTFGGGGHSREMLRRLEEAAHNAGGSNADGHLYSFDQDEDAERNVEPSDV